MWHDIADDIGIADDVEIKPPSLVDTGLPTVFGFVVLLGVQRRMVEVVGKKDHLKRPCAHRWEHLRETLMHGASSQFSSRTFGLLDGCSLLQLSFHMSNHVLRTAKRAKPAALFQVVFGFIESG